MLKIKSKIIALILLIVSCNCFAVDNSNAKYVCKHGYCMRSDAVIACEKNLAILKEQAKQKNEKALATMIGCYLGGVGTPLSYKDAEKWLKLWAKDNPTGQYNLALFYEKNRNDINSAKIWYTKAAQGGSTPAQTNLGVMYYFGKGGLLKNYNKALYWFKKASLKDPIAQYWLAMMYYEGQGVNKNMVLAAKWMKLAAKHNHPSAQTYLGDMYVAGIGVKKNYKKSVYWYKQAIKNGDPRASYALGLNYIYGQGVSKNPEKATKLFKAATVWVCYFDFQRMV